MNRCLHITINESPGAEPESATPNLPDQTSSDPGTNYVMPPPDGLVTSSDPGTNYVMPPPDGRVASRGPAAYVAAGETVHACACACAAPACPSPAGATGSTALPFGVRPGDLSGFVIVRLHEGVVANSPAETLWALAELHSPKLTGLKAVLEIGLKSALPETASPVDEPPGVLRSRPLVELKAPVEKPGGGLLARGGCLNAIRELEKKAATTPFSPLHSLTAYWRLDVWDHPDLADQVVAGLNRLAEVDLAYRELRANDRPARPIPSGASGASSRFFRRPARIRPRRSGRPTTTGPSACRRGGRYFEWDEYRAFLRQPRVAWRNTHRVAATANPALPFVIAGTPDQARAFDFEVLQRLPEKATVTLQVLPALAAKLRQHQPWLGGTAGSLPQQARTTFNKVQLAAGARDDATFLVAAHPSHLLTAGHSLALRQLWCGEEVGRITWFFGLAG